MRRINVIGVALLLVAAAGCRHAGTGATGQLAAHGGVAAPAGQGAAGSGQLRAAGAGGSHAMAAPLRTGLTHAIGHYLADRPGRAGIEVQDLRTGVTFGYQEYGRFITASVVKVNILTGLLLELQSKHRELTGGQRALATQMIRYSDNDAADALYATVGEGSALSRIDDRLGMKHTEPYPTVWGATHTCPYDQVHLLHVLTDDNSPLTPAHRRYVLGLMSTVSSSQDWGVSAAAEKGETVALKNGWTPMHYQGSGWAVHSIGRITGAHHDFLVAVFTAEQPDMETGIHTAEHLAELAVSALRLTP